MCARENAPSGPPAASAGWPRCVCRRCRCHGSGGRRGPAELNLVACLRRSASPATAALTLSTSPARAAATFPATPSTTFPPAPLPTRLLPATAYAAAATTSIAAVAQAAATATTAAAPTAACLLPPRQMHERGVGLLRATRAQRGRDLLARALARPERQGVLRFSRGGLRLLQLWRAAAASARAAASVDAPPAHELLPGRRRGGSG